MSRRTLIHIILCLLTFNLSAVNRDTLSRPFKTLVKYDLNQLYYASESVSFIRFLDKLESITNGDTGKLSIIHIGGSHIQADIYSDRLRHSFLSLTPGASSSRGLVFPYRLARTNQPSNYKFTGDKSRWKGYRSTLMKDSSIWGVTGITAELISDHDTLYFSPNPNDSLNDSFLFDKVRVYYKGGASDRPLSLSSGTHKAIPEQYDSISYSQVFRFPKPVKDLVIYCQQETFTDINSKIVTTDSITLLDSIALTDSITTEIDTIKSHIAGHGLQLMGVEIINSGGKITYNSIGVNGASFASYKRCELFYPQLKMLSVDLAIISIGTNDAYTNRFDTTSYRIRYEEMIQELIKINHDVTVVLTVPNDCYYKRKRPNKNTRLQQAIIHGLGRKYKMPVWDLYAIMGGLGSSGRWYKNKLMSRDRVHFTRKGYDLIGDLLWDSFIEAIEANRMVKSSGIDRKGESK